MGEIIYSLCALTSLLCAWLLVRSWRQTRSRLLFWSAVCFVILTVNNTLLVLDRLVWVNEVDLTIARAATSVLAVLAMIVGLVWSSD